MKFRRIFILFLTAFTLTVASCGKDDPVKPADIVTPDDDKKDDGGKKSELTVSGNVMDTDGKPFVGAVISDGRKCTVTDEKGYYEFERNRYATFITCSIPSDAVIECSGNYNMPCSHYQNVTNGKKTYDFTYRRQASEKRFRFLGLGDCQVGKDTHIERFKNETIADVRKLLNENEAVPTYAITLGDNVNNTWELFPDIAKVIGQCPVPLFSTIGNHDHEFVSGGQSDELARKKYEATFGPSSYSFNRGDCHIVSMDNVYHGASAVGDYSAGFEKFQYEWLKQDLELTDKSKMVILCVHIPFKNGFSTSDVKIGSAEILQLLSQFSSAIIVSGHTHNIQTNWTNSVNGKTIPEYVVGATCGAWWSGTICGTGDPNGYNVFELDGTKIIDEYFKSSQLPRSFQMTMMRPKDFPDFNSNDITFRFSSTDADYIYVHAFNFRKWTLTLYEDGVATATSKTVSSDYNMWAKYYYYKKDKLGKDNYTGKTNRMVKFKLKNPDAKDIKVEAVDAYGNTYVVDKFITQDNYPQDYSTLKLYE